MRSAPLVRALAGRRGAIMLPAGEAFLVALAACEGRGAVLINPLAAPPEIAHQLADAGVGAVFTITPLAARLPESIPRVLLDDAPRQARIHAGGTFRDVDLGSHVGLPLEGDPAAPGREEEAAIVYTSAMAGTPLGAILTHRALMHNARAVIAATQLRQDDRVLSVLPFAHLFGFSVTLVAPLLAGATVLPVARFHAAGAAQRLAAGDATVLVGVPALFVALLAAIERHEDPRLPEGLRMCICGGAPLRPELQERWHARTGIPLRQGYGLTEAGPVALFDGPLPPGRPWALGVPLPGVAVSIRDPETRTPLERGVTGEICVSGASLFSGYISGDAHGLALRDGWLHTGDLGVMDRDDVVTFAGVRKAMFTRNGFNIYPREIELAVQELPGVRAATVQAVPDPDRDNDIRLTIRGTATAQDVARWCARRLSAYKQPTTIHSADTPVST